MLKHALILYSLLFTQIFLAPQALASSCDYTGDAQLAAEREQCLKSKSQEWVCEVNRCMTKQDAYDLRKQFESCTQINDQAQRQGCFEKIATEQTGINRGERPKNSGLETIGMIGSTLYSLFLMFSFGTSSKAAGMSCNSKYVMIGASVAFLASHFYFKYKAKKDFDKLQKDYSESTKTLDSFDAQYKAFEYLLKEQQAIKKIAEQKKMLYTLTMAAFGIATGLAAWETYKMTTPPDFGVGTACMTEEQQNANKGQQQANQNAAKPDATAETKSSVEASNQTFDAGAGAMFWTVGTSPTNILAGGIGTGITMKLRSIAAEQVKVSEGNIKDIKEVMSKFQEQIAGFCPKGRDDYNNPRCYCYSDDKTKNKNRSKSQVCINLWAQDDKNFFVKAGNYAASETGEAKGCMSIDGKFDEDCKCRKFKDAKTGQNACAKTFVSQIDGNIGNALSLSEGVSNLNSVASGGLSSGALNQASLDKLAAKVTKARDSMIANLNNQLKGMGQAPVKIDESPILRAVATTKIPSNIASETKAADLGQISSDNRAASPMAQEIAKAVEASNIKPVNYDGPVANPLAKSGPNMPKFNFSLDGGSESTQNNTKVMEFMEKNYNYGKNDIVQREDISIFDVISNRYNISGMRRLFGDGKASEAASPDAL